MKKALIVTHVSGFVPQFEMNNVHILQEMGYEVHYASNFNNVSYGTDNHRLDGTGIVRHQVDFARSPFEVKTNIRAYWQLKKIFRNQKFELVHCHTPIGAALARIAARSYRKTGTKVVYTAHGFHFYKGAPLWYWIPFYPAERLLASCTDVLITINQEDYKRAGAFCRKKAVRVERIPGVGIDTAKFDESSLPEEQRRNIRADVRKELGVTEKQLLLLSIGELNKNKNHTLVIEALRETKKDCCYVICGEGKQRGFLEQKIQEYGLEQRVFLLGYRKDVNRLLMAADVFVLPSFREGLSCSLQEAMAASLPVIASDIRGNRELIRREYGGWLVAPADIKEMVQVINKLEKADMAAYGDFNYDRIQKYDRTIVEEKMRNIYVSLRKEKEK